ncbi:MAG: PTS transporter subunit EIIC [Eubacteriales bacterium]
MFKYFQQMGKAFMLPIAILPAAGLLLGIGGAFSAPATIESYPFLDNAFLQAILSIMSAAGGAVFSNLALLLCVGLCIGFAARDKGTAALAGVAGYIVMTATIENMLAVFNPEGNAIDTGMAGALVLGFTAVYLHNKYQNIELPAFLGFFGGARFVPIVTSFSAIFIGAGFYIVWPSIQNVLIATGIAVSGAGIFGTFIFGLLHRLGVAFGLHHVLYPMFWYSELGGVEIVNGVEVAGGQNIFFAQITDPNHIGVFTEGTRFFAGQFPMMMFGLPAACLAMYHCARPENRKKYMGVYLSAALTSLLTGITEPVEFMFLFIAPALFVVHALLTALSFALIDFFNIAIFGTFSAGLIDFSLFGILQGNDKTNWMLVIPIGIVWGFLYYGLFTFAIKKYNLMTPGRAEEDETFVTKVETKATIKEDAVLVIAALGGEENLENVDACITRLRVSVRDASLVSRDELKKIGATDVLEVAGGIQAIFGAKAILYKNAIHDIMGIDD